MHSSDLPVTEWWDPEWDVYSVPLSPFDPDVDVELWWAAYEHQWLLGWIMSGEAAYIPSKFQHQLTGLRSRPVERFGQAPACMCLYGLRHVDGIPGTHPLDPFRHAWKRGVYAFRIHPRCPHHGDARRSGVHLIEGGGLYEYVLDDDERRGH